MTFRTRQDAARYCEQLTSDMREITAVSYGVVKYRDGWVITLGSFKTLGGFHYWLTPILSAPATGCALSYRQEGGAE